MRRIVITFFFLCTGLFLTGQILPSGCYYVKEKSDSTRLLYGKSDTVWVDRAAIVTSRDFSKIKLKRAEYGYVLEITLKAYAAEKFRLASAGWLRKKMAIVVGGEVISVPIVASEISDGRIWLTNGLSSKAEMNEMKEKLKEEMKKAKN